jgi:hypothetical protein
MVDQGSIRFKRREGSVFSNFCSFYKSQNYLHLNFSIPMKLVGTLDMKINKYKIVLTICGSEGNLERRSINSLLSTAFGFRIFFVNLLIPENKYKRRLLHLQNTN